MHTFLAQEFHDIAPPVDYSLIPTWAVFGGAAIALLIIGGAVWLIIRARKRATIPVPTPRERALRLLHESERDVDYLSPYEFSIRVSDILRRYVTDEYDLPLTRQTSVEFLNAVRDAPAFSAEDRALLDDFLSRCDLIKFARYEATREDSRSLLDEATRFVRGGALEPAA